VKNNVVYACYTFFECFLKWIRVCVDDNELGGVLPDGLDLNLMDQILFDKKITVKTQKHDIRKAMERSKPMDIEEPQTPSQISTSSSDSDSDWIWGEDGNQESQSSDYE
jgi:hypothetical protein